MQEFTTDGIFQILKAFLIKDRGFNERETIKYPKNLGPVRVPLHSIKTNKKAKIVDEAVIDIFTSKTIVKEEFFPIIPTEDFNILNASTTIFYQYYFPKAKVYLAFPNYLVKDSEYEDVKNICLKQGIGMLEVSNDNVIEVIPSISLLSVILKDIRENRSRKKTIKAIIGDYLENYIIRLVYYPEPFYKRRAIIGRMTEMISYVLIDKLLELKNISYSNKLIDLAHEYRKETRNDYNIALFRIRELWKERLDLEYPEIHMHLEEILLRDVNYRDHFVHQFQVFLIGAYILDKMYEMKSYSEVLASYEKKTNHKIEDAWLAASTYHDFNYGLQNFDTWLQQFFSDTLSVNNEEAREGLSFLNLDAAMVRESLTNILSNLISFFKLKTIPEKKVQRFFYEKSVRDRNHGLLSALSLLKLYDIQGSKPDKEACVLQAAFAIACHDEDIWEALTNCRGFLKRNTVCDISKCRRELCNNKAIEVHKYELSHKQKGRKCTMWEQDVMGEKILGQISFEDWPLLFLLILSDTVQDEGRITNASMNLENSNLVETKINLSINQINEWVDSKKILKNIKLYNEIKDTFSNNSLIISDDARIFKFKLSDEKWKIIDKKHLYLLENKIGQGYFIKPHKKECYLKDIFIDQSTNEINIRLSIDDRKHKVNELKRLSWTLKNEDIKILVEEKDTSEFTVVKINGKGGL